MPVSMDKNSFFNVVLKTDKDKAKKPSFKFRYMMGDEWIKLVPDIDGLAESESGVSAGESIFNTLEGLIVGWSNMGEKVHGKDKVASFITIQEAHELLNAAFSNNQITAEDEKKSTSQSL